VGIQLHSYACAYSVVPALFVKENIPSPSNGSGTLVKNQLSTDV